MEKTFVISYPFQEPTAFMFADEPSVAIVLCTPGNDGGFYSQWWVTTKDWKSSRPILVAYLEIGVNESSNDLESALGVLWQGTIEQLCLGSAMTGGINMSSHQLRELTEQQENWVITYTLLGHDHLKHFSINSNSVVERTANMYHLLRTMGVGAIQKAIAEFESLNFAENWAKFKKDEVYEMTVKTSLINQRLVLARKSGMLNDPSDQGSGSQAKARLGRKPMQRPSKNQK